MSDSVWNAFDALLRLQDPAGAATERGRPEAATKVGPGRVFPSLNVFRQGDHFVVVAEIPGARKRDLQVHFSADELRLSGRRDVEYGIDATVHRRERSAGTFHRTLRFPMSIDPDGAKAEYRDGILAILVPRADAAKPRAVGIQADP